MEHELENLNDEKRSGYKSKKIKGLIISTVFTVISFILPISAFVYAIPNVKKCPFNPFIPIWLIIGGVVISIHHFFNIFNNARLIRIEKKKESGEIIETNNLIDIIELIVNISFYVFFVIWLVTAALFGYVGTSKLTTTNSENSNYCHSSLYSFLTKNTLIILALFGVIVIVVLIVSCIRKKSQRQTTEI